MLQHPVFKDSKNYHNLFKKTLDACAKTNLQTYIIYPNYDPGYKSIIQLINQYKRRKIKFTVFKNINREKFLILLVNSCTFVGNSSAGILESPSLKIGTVNIGDRQNFREQNKNIYNSKYNTSDIYNKILLAIKNKSKFINIKNVHGDGKSSRRIAKVLEKIKIEKEILNKNTTY